MGIVVIFNKEMLSIATVLMARPTSSSKKRPVMNVTLVDNYGPENHMQLTEGRKYTWEELKMNPTTLTSISGEDWRMNINYVTGNVTTTGNVTYFLD